MLLLVFSEMVEESLYDHRIRVDANEANPAVLICIRLGCKVLRNPQSVRRLEGLDSFLDHWTQQS
jgi:hypothetical protein